jgi:hypothetical protein
MGKNTEQMTASYLSEPSGAEVKRKKMQAKLWTRWEKDVFSAMVEAGRTNKFIAKAMGRTESAIDRMRYYQSGPQKLKGKKLCLRCGKRFTSYGVSNRICYDCNVVNAQYSHLAAGVTSMECDDE